MSNFRELRVWQIAKNLAVDVNGLIKKNEQLSQDYRLKDQMWASAVSIASHIAEGDKICSNQMSNKHFYIAKGSTAELMTQLILSNEIDYVTKEESDKLIDKCERVSTMLQRLIIARL